MKLQGRASLRKMYDGAKSLLCAFFLGTLSFVALLFGSTLFKAPATKTPVLSSVQEVLVVQEAHAGDQPLGIARPADVAEKDPALDEKFKSDMSLPSEDADLSDEEEPIQVSKSDRSKVVKEIPVDEDEEFLDDDEPPVVAKKNPPKTPVEEDGKANTPGLVRVSHDALMDEILRRLDSPDERTRLEATLALRKNAQQSDVEDLAKRLKQGNNRDKQLALIEALGGLQDKRAGDALRFEVDHGDEVTRRAAVTALGNLNYNWPVPILAKVLRKDKDEELKKRAASALGQIGTPQAIYTLRTSLALLDENPGAKNAAFWALEKARGEIDEERIDTEMPRGRRIQLYYNGTRYYFYHPANRREAGVDKSGLRPWLLVCIHDGDLRAEEVFNICYRSAKKAQLAVLVPVIDNMRYPDYGTFNIRGERFDKRLLELIEHVGQHAGLNVREFYLFGYGTGGDFVQKFSMVYPKRIAKVAYECTGFTMPDPEAYFPKGLNRSPLSPDIGVDMYQVMKTDQMLILRKNSEALRNGKEYFEAMEHYSQINGIRERLNVRTVDVKFEIWNEAEKFLLSTD